MVRALKRTCRDWPFSNDLKTGRQKYQIEVGATMLTRTMVFDTQEIKQHYCGGSKAASRFGAISR
jgi:hypothetical protein